MSITAKDVNELRKKTGAGMMDCKKALTESNGDMEGAIDFLRKKGQKIAAKRGDRDAREGLVISKSNNVVEIKPDNNSSIILSFKFSWIAF